MSQKYGFLAQNSKNTEFYEPLWLIDIKSKGYNFKGALICGEGRQTKHLSILQMSVLHRSEQGICVPNAPVKGAPLISPVKKER